MNRVEQKLSVWATECNVKAIQNGFGKTPRKSIKKNLWKALEHLLMAVYFVV